MEWRLPRSWLVDGLSEDLHHFLDLLLVLQDFRHLLLFFSTILWCLPSSVAFLKFSFSVMLWCPDLPCRQGLSSSMLVNCPEFCANFSWVLLHRGRSLCALAPPKWGDRLINLGLGRTFTNGANSEGSKEIHAERKAQSPFPEWGGVGSLGQRGQHKKPPSLAGRWLLRWFWHLNRKEGRQRSKVLHFWRPCFGDWSLNICCSSQCLDGFELYILCFSKVIKLKVNFLKLKKRRPSSMCWYYKQFKMHGGGHFWWVNSN